MRLQIWLDFIRARGYFRTDKFEIGVPTDPEVDYEIFCSNFGINELLAGRGLQ